MLKRHVFAQRVTYDTHHEINEQLQSQNASNCDADTDDVIGNDSTTPLPAQHNDPPLLHSKVMLILNKKEERRLSQVAIDGLIDDVSTLLEVETLSLKRHNLFPTIVAKCTWAREVYNK